MFGTTANQNPLIFTCCRSTTAPSTGCWCCLHCAHSLATGHNADNDGVFRIRLIHGDNTYNVADAADVNVEVTVDSGIQRFQKWVIEGQSHRKPVRHFPRVVNWLTI